MATNHAGLFCNSAKRRFLLNPKAFDLIIGEECPAAASLVLDRIVRRSTPLCDQEKPCERWPSVSEPTQ
jgi:hypothetical protein